MPWRGDHPGGADLDMPGNGYGGYGGRTGLRPQPQTGLRRRRTYSGHGADMDIIVASAKAYMSALNKMLAVYADKTNRPELENA
jgi:hypothetical protein